MEKGITTHVANYEGVPENLDTKPSDSIATEILEKTAQFRDAIVREIYGIREATQLLQVKMNNIFGMEPPSPEAKENVNSVKFDEFFKERLNEQWHLNVIAGTELNEAVQELHRQINRMNELI